jgi:hypothetical protein
VGDFAQGRPELNLVSLCESVTRDAPVPFPGGDPQFQPGEMGAEATMHASTEGDVGLPSRTVSSMAMRLMVVTGVS